MSRWWRAYDESVDDPKLIMLSDSQHRAWFNLLCVASMYGGTLPDTKTIAIKLRMKEGRVMALLDELRAAELIDDDGEHIRPHNWDARQFKSDVSTERVKRFRKQKRNVSETPPETETDTDTDTEKIPELRSGAVAPRDVRADLFGIGLKTLANITGQTPDSCRSLVGKWLKSVNDEAIHVLAAIEDAERNRVADPVAWINRALNKHGANGHGKRTVHDAAADLLERVRSLDEPVPSELRDTESAGAVRRLPSR